MHMPYETQSSRDSESDVQDLEDGAEDSEDEANNDDVDHWESQCPTLSCEILSTIEEHGTHIIEENNDPLSELEYDGLEYLAGKWINQLLNFID